MKKIINAPKDVVEEMVAGLVGAIRLCQTTARYHGGG